MNSIHADLSASISELKKSPTGLLNQAGGRPIAILNHNKPTAYLIPADMYASMVAVFEDVELLKVAQKRQKEKRQAIQVGIDDL